MSDYYDDYGGGYYEDPGSPVVDWFDNGDGSWTNLADGSLWEGDTQIGWAFEDGSWSDLEGNLFDENNQMIGIVFEDGSWMDLDGTLFGADDTPIATAPTFDSTFEFDADSGLWFDTLTGAWLNEAGEVVRYEGDAASATGGGFWEGVGNFLGKIFGGGKGQTGGGFGGGGGGGFGGGSSSSGQQQQQAQQRAQQQAQQLARAQQQGASASQLAQLQRQLTMSQNVLGGAAGGGLGTTILVASAVGLGVYALASSRRETSAK